jgi:uncharacterized FlgJ-related protein
MKLFITLFSFLFLSSSITYSQRSRRISADAYIDAYKNIAISEMKRSGIPASITLAQGMLESDNGNSSLVTEGNNHFGIKCHDWKGPAIYKDDDSRNECFRKYKSAEESYRDHTDFLLSKQRYNFLFSYKSTDYKSWAKGLKKAGYATNPNYPEKLIRIIEDNNLHLYDLDVAIADKTRMSRTSRRKGTISAGSDFTINLNRHPVYKRNNVEYTVAKNGDSVEKLAREMEMFNWELLKYNELTKDSTLHEGEILYLQPKRRRAERGKDFHTVQPGESVYSISQLYGVKSKLIRKFNHLSPDSIVNEGTVLNLRFKKKNY